MQREVGLGDREGGGARYLWRRRVFPQVQVIRLGQECTFSGFVCGPREVWEDLGRPCLTPALLITGPSLQSFQLAHASQCLPCSIVC